MHTYLIEGNYTATRGNKIRLNLKIEAPNEDLARVKAFTEAWNRPDYEDGWVIINLYSPDDIRTVKPKEPKVFVLIVEEPDNRRVFAFDSMEKARNAMLKDIFRLFELGFVSDLSSLKHTATSFDDSGIFWDILEEKVA